MNPEKEAQPEKQSEPSAAESKAVAPREPREIRVVTDTGPLSYIWDTARFEHMFRLATAMASATLIPEHLRQTRKGEPFTPEQVKCNCFRLINQALRWGVDPWSIIDDSFVTGGKLGYQGKVIAALVNTKAPIKQRLKDSYSGTKGSDDFTITVSGTFIGEEEPREVTLSVGEAKTENQMWRSDPSQKLWYSAVVRWARKYCPELVVGVFTEDDAERMHEWRAAEAKQAHAAPARTEAPNFAPSAEELPKKAKARELVQGQGKTLVGPAEAEANIAEAAAEEVIRAEKAARARRLDTTEEKDLPGRQERLEAAYGEGFPFESEMSAKPEAKPKAKSKWQE
jgi:hypothetical protein